MFQPATQSWGRTPARNSLVVGWGFSLGIAGLGHVLLGFIGGGSFVVLRHRLSFGFVCVGNYATGLAISSALKAGSRHALAMIFANSDLFSDI